jgi:hypothetical protein
LKQPPNRAKIIMKKLILSAALMAFAVAIQAGDAKVTREAGSCCSTKTSTQVKGTCTMAGKTACSEGACKNAPVKQALLSPKAAAEVTKRL